MRLSCQNSGSMWLCPGVIHKLKERSLSAKTRGQSVKRFITWLLALVYVDVCCKVTGPEALSSQTWLLILQWELDSMSNTSGGGLRQCPGTAGVRNLSAKQGLTGASRNTSGPVARHSRPRRYSSGTPVAAPERLMELLATAFTVQWLDFISEVVKILQGRRL